MLRNFTSLIATLFFFNFALNAQYCALQGTDSSEEWIESISIANYENPTGNNFGYLDNTAETIVLESGQYISLVLTPGYSSDEFTEYWKVWIDYNQDGDFSDANETVYSSGNGYTGIQTGGFTIPNNAVAGETRIRFAMKWVGNLSGGASDLAAPLPCGSFSYGEVEDYTVNIVLPEEPNHCLAFAGSSESEWIESVQFESFTNTSNNDNGYGDYTDQNITLNKNDSKNFTLTSGYSGTNYTEHWRIWVDFNRDLDFDDANELLFDSEAGVANMQSGNIEIPSNISNGETKMRIAMKWVGEFEDGTTDYTAPESCGSFDYGEVEDYTVVIENEIIEEAQAPVSNFTTDVNSGQAPLSVNFTDQSEFSPDVWSWSFPGGTPAQSNEQNPAVVYSEPGVYTVTLTTTNEEGSNEEVKTNFITVTDNAVAPVADFQASSITGQLPLTVSFSDLSSNLPQTWNWSFESGFPSISSEANPTIVFSEAGTFSITLTVSNEAGVDTEFKQSYITVTEPSLAPVANFTSNITSGTAPLQVSFSDISSNSPTSRLWTFAGANQSSSLDANPVVTYETPGVYPVTLAVTNSIGEDEKTIAAYITVNDPITEPVVSFTASIYEGDAPMVVTFFDQSSNEPNSWEWEFPGAVPASSNEKNPSITYNNPGIFPVSLTVTNAAGSASKTQEGFITVGVNTATEEIEISNFNIIAYPNPAQDFVNIDLDLFQLTDPEIQVFNLLGQQMDQLGLEAADQTSLKLNIQNYPAGTYFISLIDQGEMKLTKRIQVIN